MRNADVTAASGRLPEMARAIGSEDQRIKLAKPIVAGKIANMRALT
jgi:CRISPR/Cas system-associated endonuclease Cas1